MSHCTADASREFVDRELERMEEERLEASRLRKSKTINRAGGEGSEVSVCLKSNRWNFKFAYSICTLLSYGSVSHLLKRQRSALVVGTRMKEGHLLNPRWSAHGVSMPAQSAFQEAADREFAKGVQDGEGDVIYVG